MGGPQKKTCSNCKDSDNKPEDSPCVKCLGLPDYPYWKTRRGRPPGYKRNPGAKKTGPKEFEDREELRQDVRLYFKANDIKKAGGIKKVKEYLEVIFYKLIKGL